MQRGFVRLLNSIVSVVEGLALVVILLYAVYALWDNQHVYMRASSVQQDLLAFKPKVEEETGPSFEELQEINPDVCAWLTMDNTRIDFAVLQGENNFEYLSLDVYGEFSLAGSIYLDSRNGRDFGDAYSLLHGHHLDQGRMFGDLDLYKDQTFFDENTTGTLITPEGQYDLEVIAYMPLLSTDQIIFAPQRYLEDAADVLAYIPQTAKYLHEETYTRAQTEVAAGNASLFCMATCSPESSDARTIILCLMTAADAETEVAV